MQVISASFVFCAIWAAAVLAAPVVFTDRSVASVEIGTNQPAGSALFATPVTRPCNKENHCTPTKRQPAPAVERKALKDGGFTSSGSKGGPSSSSSSGNGNSNSNSKTRPCAKSNHCGPVKRHANGRISNSAPQ